MGSTWLRSGPLECAGWEGGTAERRVTEERPKSDPTPDVHEQDDDAVQCDGAYMGGAQQIIAG